MDKLSLLIFVLLKNDMHLAIRFLYLLMLNEEKKKRGVHRFNNKMPLVNIFMFYVFTSCLLSVVEVFI